MRNDCNWKSRSSSPNFFSTASERASRFAPSSSLNRSRRYLFTSSRVTSLRLTVCSIGSFVSWLANCSISSTDWNSSFACSFVSGALGLSFSVCAVGGGVPTGGVGGCCADTGRTAIEIPSATAKPSLLNLFAFSSQPRALESNATRTSAQPSGCVAIINSVRSFCPDMAASTQSALAPELAIQLSAILRGAAVAVLGDRRFLRITGPDAARWLNGMVTNAIQTLQPGEGNYNFLLNAQGQIQGDCTIYRDPNAAEPAYVLETSRSQIEAIQQHLDKYIIMDDVELKSVDEYPETVLILGPRAADVLRNISETCGIAELEPQHLASSGSLQITTPSAAPVPEFEIATASAASLLQSLVNAGASDISAEALEAFRILSGTPRYGIDIRPRDLPQDTAQAHAFNFSKGCYLGQEIVE